MAISDPRTRTRARVRTGVTVLALGLASVTVPARAAEPLRLRIVGGLANVAQFTRYEEPFWSRQVPEITGGRIRPTIQPFDRAGLRGQDMLQLIRLGVVSFGTTTLSVAAGDDPELNGADLPGMNPDIASLRATVRAFRPHLAAVLRERYGVELLAVYAYPAQVIYCAKPFVSLADLEGRRVRTSSVGQSEFVGALKAHPVITPFSEVVGSVASGVVDCAITGTLSGNEVGLAAVTSYLHPLAISWGLSVFTANRVAWEAIPQELRDTLSGGIAGLEDQIWDAADRETARGVACNTGTPTCTDGKPGRMTLLPVTPADERERRRVLIDAVVPGWFERCGGACVAAWRDVLAPAAGLKAARP